MKATLGYGFVTNAYGYGSKACHLSVEARAFAEKA
jgi:hypothetical protein